MSYGSEAAALNALLSIFAGFWLIILAFFVLNIVAGWKIFEKAAHPDGRPSSRFTTATSGTKSSGATAGCSLSPSSALYLAASRCSARCWSSLASSSTS